MIEGRDVVSLGTFTPAEIRWVVDHARRLKERPLDPCLQGRSLAMVFFDPSLRTRASFAIAFSSLGGTVIDLVAGQDLWPLEFREGGVMDGLADEHVRDAATVLSAYADVIAIRALGRHEDWAQERRDRVIVSFQKHAGAPIFNMESVLDHPCQAWGDALTLSEALGEPEGKRLTLAWSYHPKARPPAVPHGVGTMAAKLGMQLTIAHPEGFGLDGRVLASMQHTASSSGGEVRIEHDLDKALEGADVVYAAPWCSLNLHAQPEEESALRGRYTDWRITGEHMRRTQSARFMHAMPIRRNVEAEDAVVDSDGSLVVEQAANRLHIQRALFRAVLGV